VDEVRIGEADRVAFRDRILDMIEELVRRAELGARGRLVVPATVQKRQPLQVAPDRRL